MFKTLLRNLSILTIVAAAAAPLSPAYGQKERNQPASKGKKSSLEATKRVKYKDKTSVDFDEANIDGSAKNPFGSIVNSRDQNFDKGFIKLRYHWHDQMVMSLSGLSGN
ncbi:MAG: hypothetical protein IOD12_07860 [Silvanigrellales bacterium]|jgi:hypothetical protein|nr:hypothetical protein [Silvanigrellales bacterium]